MNAKKFNYNDIDLCKVLVKKACYQYNFNYGNFGVFYLHGDLAITYETLNISECSIKMIYDRHDINKFYIQKYLVEIQKNIESIKQKEKERQEYNDKIKKMLSKWMDKNADNIAIGFMIGALGFASGMFYQNTINNYKSILDVPYMPNPIFPI